MEESQVLIFSIRKLCQSTVDEEASMLQCLIVSQDLCPLQLMLKSGQSIILTRLFLGKFL